MILDNCDKDLFTTYFGEEGYELIKPYDIRVILVNNDMEQAKAMSDLNAWVCNWLPEGSTQLEIALFINVERIYEEFTLMDRLVETRRRRVYVGTLVHELTHVRQMQEGRLISKNDHYLWEGKVYKLHASLPEYLAQPWEVEAHIEQFMYLYDIDKETATTTFNERCKEF